MPMYLVPNQKTNNKVRFKDPIIYNRVSNIHKSPTPDLAFHEQPENAIAIPDVTEFLKELEIPLRPKNEPQKDNPREPSINMSPYRAQSIKNEPQIPRSYNFNEPNERKFINATFWDPIVNAKTAQPQTIQEKRFSPDNTQSVPQVIQYNDDPELCECHGL
jgi:hypothetical protein